MKEKSPFYNFMHLGIVVKDIDQAMATLGRFGIGPFEECPDLKGAPVFRGKVSDAAVSGKLFHFGGIEMELNQPLHGETSQQEYLDEKGEGIHHIGFMVDDMKAGTDYMTGKGFDVMLSGESEGEQWNYFDIKTGGLILQLTQRDEDG